MRISDILISFMVYLNYSEITMNSINSILNAVYHTLNVKLKSSIGHF